MPGFVTCPLAVAAAAAAAALNLLAVDPARAAHRRPAHLGLALSGIATDRARYSPGASVTLTVTLTNDSDGAVRTGRVGITVEYLGEPVPGTPGARPFRLARGHTGTFQFVWKAPVADFRGYVVQAWVRSDTARRPLALRTTAVDVSSTWTKFPRCGFLSECPPQPLAKTRQMVDPLASYHLNVIQFYDWQHKHQRPLAGSLAQPAATWKNIANRTNARQTVLDAIATAHGRGMAALNYNLIYGAWDDYGADGVDPRWALWKDRNHTTPYVFPLPAGWATPRIDFFDPGNADWQRYLIGQEAKVFAAYPFDGWQVDQVGNAGEVYDYDGHPVTVWQRFVPFLKAAKAQIGGKALVFNNVGGYGLYDTAANSGEDAVYVECWEWEGQRTYADLKELIDQTAAWSRGKGVILPAYMDRKYAEAFQAAAPGRFNTPGVLLTNAAIFASGGSHLELGDGDAMLNTDYFPNHNLLPSPELRRSLHRYYDFLVGYENLLRGGLANSAEAIELSVPSSPDAAPQKVWTFAKAGGERRVLHLINLIGESENAWRDENASYPPPTPQTNVTVTYHCGPGRVCTVRWASPDTADIGLHVLPFTTGADSAGPFVRFTVPALAYWDMVYLTMAQ